MNIEKFIESGILEGYVLNIISIEDRATVEEIAKKNNLVKKEISLIEKSLESFSSEHKIIPPNHLKTKIIDQIKEEKIFSSPPILTENSKIEDYQLWIDKIEPPENYENMYMKVIGDYKTAKMVIAWIKDGETNHSHSEYTEIFLIVEGSCSATINGKTKSYNVGNYVRFPINSNHSYKVTSKKPMKVIACLAFKAA